MGTHISLEEGLIRTYEWTEEQVEYNLAPLQQGKRRRAERT
jgi:hypothetical protein